jgi:hypothetical protein
MALFIAKYMHLSIPIPAFCVEICAKILIFVPKMLSDYSRSNPFNSALDPFLGLFVSNSIMNTYIRGVLLILRLKVP